MNGFADSKSVLNQGLLERISQARQALSEMRTNDPGRYYELEQEARAKRCRYSPNCHDGMIIDVRTNLSWPCQCQIDKLREQKFEEMGLPPGYREAVFDKFDFSKYLKSDIRHKGISAHQMAMNAYLACLDAGKRFPGELREKKIILFGPSGSGKTFLACCLFNYLVARNEAEKLNLTFSRIDVNRMVNTFRAWTGENRRQEILDAAKLLGEVDVLILDELTETAATPFAQDFLFDILVRRQSGKLTITTTNLAPPKLKELFEQRILFRLYQEDSLLPLAATINWHTGEMQKTEEVRAKKSLPPDWDEDREPAYQEIAAALEETIIDVQPNQNLSAAKAANEPKDNGGDQGEHWLERLARIAKHQRVAGKNSVEDERLD